MAGLLVPSVTPTPAVQTGGMTLISTTTMSGSSVNLTSIPQTYNSLFLIITGMTANTSNAKFQLLPNSNTGIADYEEITVQAIANRQNSRIQLSALVSTLRTNANNAWAVRIDNYTSTAAFKPFTYQGRWINAASSIDTILGGGTISTTAAITNLEFNYEFGYVFSAGTILLYGVK
jgi:hypothetical protein